MKKPSYELDYDDREYTDSGSRRVRLAALFVLVAALTAGGIYLLVPHHTEEPAPVQETDPLQNAADTLAEITPDPDPIPPIPAEGTPPPQPDPQPEQQPEILPEAVADPDVSEDPGTVPPEEVPPADQEPIKGRPHASDPVDDGPRIAPDAIEPYGFARNLQRITELLESKKYLETRREAEKLLPELTVNSDQWRKVMRVLGRANVQLYFQQGQTGRDGATHTIQNGDTLFRIARQYGLSVDALRRLNGMKANESKLLIGKKLRVGTSGWQIRISKAARLLVLECGGKPFAIYDIGIGRLGRTPSGRFLIGEKLENPSYQAPDGRTIAPGAPGNELGTRWMRLNAPPGTENPPQGYGIHGTADESSVTRPLSNGCIRMRNAEVEELFLIVPVNTPVLIEE